MSRAENTQGELNRGGGAKPRLLDVQILPQRLGVRSLAIAAVLAGVFAFGLQDTGWLSDSTDVSAPAPKTIFVSPADVEGAFFPLPPELSKGTQRVMALIKMTAPEKERLSYELESGNIRIAAIWLWDNQAEDGDAVQVAAGGFSQNISISNSPTMYYVPVQTGTSARITAISDGGGGVTLGVKTIVGPFPLPPLVVGQSLEVPIL